MCKEKYVLETRRAAQKYKQLCDSAFSRNIEFTLTFSDVKRLTKKKKCYYTGEAFSNEAGMQLTIDRVDCTKGYVPGNVVACSHKINNLKSILFEDPTSPRYVDIVDVRAILSKL